MNSGGFVLFPSSASTFASQVDGVTFGLLGICGLIFIGVACAILYFGIRYRKSSKANRRMSENREAETELFWTIAPLIIMLGIFIWGAVIYFKMHEPPKNAMQITLVGKQWMWKFEHENGIRELNELHIPVGIPIELIMASQDVIHSFFVPAFRVKQDIVPGRYVGLWFQATKPGRYRFFCTQYCGTSHSKMIGEVVALAPSDFQAWKEGLSQKTRFTSLTRVDHGKYLYNHLACFACHETQGKLAPVLNHLYGKQVELSDGQKVLADDAYLRESILNPRAKIVSGYTAIMPSYQGQVSEEELMDLIFYLKAQ